MREVEHVNRVNLDHTLGPHFGIFGAGGKSTLARAIARKLDLAYIEIDAIQHLPGWQMRPKDEVETIINQCMVSSTGGWVTDHNYRSILERAESIIVLELPFRTVFWRRLKRSLHRAWTQELVCGGNTETFKQHLLTRESAILEAWVRRKSYGRIYEALSPDMPTEADVFYIRTTRQLNQFYEAHGLSRSPDES